MEKIIHTAIIGFGLSGKVFHAPFIDLHPGFNLSTILERSSDQSKKLYPDITIAKDLEAVLSDEQIDLVVICTPNVYHFPMAKSCLEAGKHIVVEKPFMPSTKEADEIIKLAEKLNRKVFVYHNRRWDGDYLTMQKLLRSRLLGTIEYFEAHFDRYSPQRTRAAWRDEQLPGSGNLFDLGSHLIDQVLDLFGNPNAVSADIQSQRPGSQVDDFFEIRMIYPEMQAVVTAGMLVEDSELRYIINGTKGSYVKYGIDPQEALLKQGVTPDADDWGMEDFENWGLASFVHHELFFEGAIETEPGDYMGFYQNVYDVLTSDAELVIPPESARNVIQIIEMAFESAKNQKEIIFPNNKP